MSSDSPTKGFRLNHVGLRVADLEKSIEFYTGVFGMKELYRMPLETVTIVFLGYPDALVADIPMLAQQGALELVCPKVRSHVGRISPLHRRMLTYEHRIRVRQ